MTNLPLPDFVSYIGITVASLFPIANPIGAVPLFYSLTSGDSKREQVKLAKKIAINVTLILIVFLLFGTYILKFFGLSLDMIRIAGGLIVANTAWKMVEAKQKLTRQEHEEASEKEDISFTPMALPMIAGPASIGIVIALGSRTRDFSHYIGCGLGIILFGIIVYALLVSGKPLIDRLGKNGVGALNRILGFLILSIAVEMIASGIVEIFQKSATGALKSGF